MTTDFDPKPLADLKRDLDAESAREIIQSYLDEAPQLLAQAQEAWKQRKPPEFQRAVHTLKSTSLALGALRLAEAAKTLEHEARSGRLPDDASKVDELAELFEAIRGRLAAWSG